MFTIKAGKKGLGTSPLFKQKTSGMGHLLNLDKDKIESIADGNKQDLELSIELLIPNKEQPRKNFAEDELDSLMDSINKHGIIQPIVVRKLDDSYQIVAGERRFRAAKRLGLKTVPVIIKNYSTEEVTEIALVENLQRQDLDPIEEAYAYTRLVDVFKQTQEMIAARLGRSRSHVANMMRLLNLPEPIRRDLSVGDLSIGQARPLLSLPSEDAQIELAERIKDEELNARQVEQLVKKILNGTNQSKPKEKLEDTTEIKELVERLKLSLGSPVAIKFKSAKNISGTIQITFSSEDELNRLMSYIEQNNTPKNDIQTVENTEDIMEFKL